MWRCGSMRGSSPRVPGSASELAHDDLKRIVVRQRGAHVGAGERVNRRPRLAHVLGRDLRPTCGPRRSGAAHERPRGPLPPQLPCPPSADLEDAAVVRAVVMAEPGDEGGDIGGLERLSGRGGIRGVRHGLRQSTPPTPVRSPQRDLRAARSPSCAIPRWAPRRLRVCRSCLPR